jgi:hypothetical protein
MSAAQAVVDQNKPEFCHNRKFLNRAKMNSRNQALRNELNSCRRSAKGCQIKEGFVRTLGTFLSTRNNRNGGLNYTSGI